MRALALLLLVSPGCQCGFDAGKLDDLACETDEECSPDQDCVEGACIRRDCEDAQDCGDDVDYRCEGEKCWAQGCDECGDGFECHDDGFCRPGSPADGGAGCRSDSDCDDDLFCNGAESCDAGACSAGAPPDCEGLEVGPCDVARCDEDADRCTLGDHPCDDGLPCTTDVCEDETCSYGLADEACLIDDVCREAGEVDPDNGCRKCDPGADASSWTIDDDAPCTDGDPCTRDDACTAGECSGVAYSCDDSLDCTEDTCDGAGGCSNERDPSTCLIDDRCLEAGDPSPDDPCDACNPDVDGTAFSPDDAADCDDGDPCTSGDACVAGDCGGTPYSCDDSVACTTDECDGEGGCTHPVVAGSCLIDGVCRAAGEIDPANACRECSPGQSAIGWTNDDTNGSSDGLDCTTDGCAAGQETHVADDARCEDQDVCAPCAGGCVALPVLSVSCPDVPVVPGAGAAACTVTLTSAGQASCLSCGSLLGPTSLVRDTFTGCPDLASIGWTVDGGDDPSCPADSRLPLDVLVEEDQLDFENADNSSLQRRVDTTGFDSVRLCFDWADQGAGAGTDLRVELDTGVFGFDVVWSDPGGPFPSSDFAWKRECLDLVALDPAAADNSDLGIRIEIDGNTLYLDNIAVDAWNAANVLYPGRVVDDPFTGCDLTGWDVAGDPVCPVVTGNDDGRDALEATNDRWTLTRTVDLSDRCGDVRVGFSQALRGPDGDDFLTLTFDRGAGPTRAWSNYRAVTANATFAAVFVDLSFLDPLVRFHKALTIAFDATSADGDTVLLDDVWVDGIACGSGDAVLTVGDAADSGGGAYRVDLSSPVRATSWLECTWDGRAGTTARDQMLFCGAGGQDACAPDATETEACGECGTRTRTCAHTCTWGPWGACNDHPCCCDDGFGGCEACCC